MDELTPHLGPASAPVETHVTAQLPSPAAEVSQSETGADDEQDEGKSYADVVLRAKKRFEYVSSVDDRNRKNQLDDTKFAWERGAQWNEDVRRKRETAQPPRPWLEFNQTGPYIKRITNDQRQNQPAIKVRPAGEGAKQEIAHIYSGLIRSIEYCSQAPSIYDSAIENAATGGRGYFRIITEYESETSFNQVLRLRGIPNPAAVYLDPDAQAPDKSDARYGFVCEWIDKATYEEEWPGAGNAVSWDSTARDPAEVFFDGEKVCVADYYEVVDEPVELLRLDNGRTVWADQYAQEQLQQAPVAPLAMAMGILPPQIMRREERTRRRVDWYKVTARDEPLAVYEWAGKYVPIICVPGDEIDIAGRKVYQGVITRLRDAQMMYNYWFTLATERIALAPRAPWIGATGQFEGHPQWEDANTENHPYLEYEFVQAEDGTWVVAAPQRTEPIPVDAGLIQMLTLCANVIRDITGQRDGTPPNPNVPWRAIMAEQRKGDLATFHYGDNLARGIAFGGRQLVDLIPHVYDTQRQIRILEEDGTDKSLTVNQQMPHPETGQPVTLNDLSCGCYDVAVDVGPSFATRRMEAVADMKDFMEAMGPQTASVIGDLFAKQSDWPGNVGEQVAARLFAMLPPNIQAIASGDDPQAAAMQGALTQMQQQMQQMQQAAMARIKELTDANAMLQLQVKNKQLDFLGGLVETDAKRDDVTSNRMMAAENNASQEFIAKLDLIGDLVGLMAKQMGLPTGPMLAQAATDVGAAGQAVRRGPDFSDVANALQASSDAGNAQIMGIAAQAGLGAQPESQPAPQPQMPPQPPQGPLNGGQP